MKGAKWFAKCRANSHGLLGWKSAIFQHLSVVKQLTGRWSVCVCMCVAVAAQLSSILNVMWREKKRRDKARTMIWISPPLACLNRQDLHVVFLARAAGQGEEVGEWLERVIFMVLRVWLPLENCNKKKQNKTKKQDPRVLATSSIWPDYIPRGVLRHQRQIWK